MEIYTIGFTGKTAEEFFEALRRAGIKRLVDVRLRNSSQLAGFAKASNLPYLLRELCAADYVHEPRLAPSQELLADWAEKQIGWDEYEQRFRATLAERRAEEVVRPESFEAPTVLLCSEAKPEHCHRRLVAEYLQARWDDVRVVHL